jgi:hypothetical protein
MAHNEALAGRIRQRLADIPKVHEVKIMGGPHIYVQRENVCWRAPGRADVPNRPGPSRFGDEQTRLQDDGFHQKADERIYLGRAISDDHQKGI